MPKHEGYDGALQKLKGAGASMRCKDVVEVLRNLGFKVRDGSKGGHKVITHPGLAGFITDGFDCGHGNNPEVKRPYLTKIIKLLERYEDDLRTFLNGEST
jgi:predicted RNA binding protein YcfA (HicA-like mRNA interferase family)